MRRLLVFWGIGWLGLLALFAQQPYLLYLTDKDSLQACPSDILSVHAQQRRQRQGITPWDAKDWPVKTAYVARIKQTGVPIRHVLRWPNAVSVWASAEQVQALHQLPFIKDIWPLSAAGVATRTVVPDDGRLDTLLNLIDRQLHLDGWKQAGYRGQGIRLAVFDTGFKEADSHPALARLRERQGIIATRDFYQGDDRVYHHDRHGMEVLSCLAGDYRGRPLGYAPDAEYLLARVEHVRKELAVEEDHWMAAAEWAEQMGADIILSALTYTDKRYTYAQMDGQTALVSQAARIATQKGVLVVNSVGNEGARPWRFVAAPADVPEVLTVGATFPMLRMRQPYSSFGPNAAGAIKPDLAAPGFVVSAWKRGQFDENAGTSFSAPLVAGLAACALQADTTMTPAQLHLLMRQSSHLYPYFDYALGYGVPDTRALFGLPTTASDSAVGRPFSVELEADSVLIQFAPAVVADTAGSPYGRMLYYHLQNPSTGQLSTFYGQNLPNGTKGYAIWRSAQAKGILRVWFAGHLIEKLLE